jgi:hypothetical protein
VTWRVVAEREARKRVKRAVTARLSQSPYGLSAETIDRIFETAKMVDIAYADNDKSIALTYEILLEIKKGP